MIVFDETTTLTKEQWDSFFRSAKARGAPSTMLVSETFLNTFRIVDTSIKEGWDRRREKREVRKGGKSNYHKRPK